MTREEALAKVRRVLANGATAESLVRGLVSAGLLKLESPSPMGVLEHTFITDPMSINCKDPGSAL